MKFSALLAVLKILFGCGFTVVVAGSLGRWFLIATGAWQYFDPWERRIFAFGLGAAWLSNIVFALSAAHLVYPAVFLVVGCVLLGLSVRLHRAPVPDPRPPSPGPRPPIPWFIAPVLAAYGYLYFLNALAPEISPDGASYHLGLVGRYLREHGFSRITTHMYAMLSQGVEMLFLFAYALGRHSAAKLTHFAFLIATTAAILCFGRRFGLGLAGVVAAVLFACSPVVGVDGTCAYNDCALAFFTFLTFYLLLIWDDAGARELWPAIGVAAGFCFSIKYTGFLALPFALGFIVWKTRRAWFAPALTVVVFGSLFVAPWLIKDAIIVRNPVAPFFNRWFPNPYIHVSFEQIYAFFMRHYSGIAEHNWADYWKVPWELAVAGGKLQGLLGPVFLLTPLGLLALRKKIGRRVWFAAVIFALPWFSNIGTRFLIPSLVFLSLALALAVWELPRKLAIAISTVLVSVHAVSSWPAIIDRWNKHFPWHLDPPPWKAALRIEKEPDYLARVEPLYNVSRMLDEKVPPGKRVFSPSGVMEAYTAREVLVRHQCALCEVIMDFLIAPVVYDVGPVWNIRFDWEPKELGGVRVVQTASDPVEMWSIHEMLLYSGKEYLVPKPTWLLRARPNPWDAALAMDGNPATRWRSWYPLYPGMKFQVDFPEPLRLSAMELLCSSDQQMAVLRLEAKDASGRWSPLPARMRRTDCDAPREEMKKLATSEVKLRGVDYILTDVVGEGMNLIGPHIAKNPEAWGLRLVGSYGPVRLYEIQ